jgi:hypothetical protein
VKGDRNKRERRGKKEKQNRKMVPTTLTPEVKEKTVAGQSFCTAVLHQSLARG